MVPPGCTVRAWCASGAGLGRIIPELGAFFVRGVAPRSCSQVAQGDAGDVRAEEAGDGAVETGEHAAHLPLSAFVQLEGATAGAGSGAVGTGRTVVEVDAAFEASAGGLVERAAFAPHAVALDVFVAGVGEALGEGAIVGEEEQPFAVEVEASDGVQAGLVGDEVEDGGSPLRVVARGDDALRFVEEQERTGDAGVDGVAVEVNVATGGDATAERGGDAVDRDASGGDEVLRLAA